MKSKKLVFGVGINDADYKINKKVKVGGKWKVIWRCHYYERWTGMLKRCYSERSQEKRPTYKGCTVCEEWLLFSTFKKWMEVQNWEDSHLDKDFLIEGNKVYSPSTCVFLPRKLNTFITTSGKARGKYPLGVCYRKKTKGMVNEYSKPYLGQVNDQTGRPVYLGLYSAPEEAHQRYLEEKLKYCKEYIEEYKDEPLIMKGLTRIKDKIQHHIENNLELTGF